MPADNRMISSDSTSLNSLLASLPADDYSRIVGRLKVVQLKDKHTLQKAGDIIREVYFPGQSLSSMLVTMPDGCTADVATIGREGLLGVEAVFGLTQATCDVTVRIAGTGNSYTLDIDAFRTELHQRGAFFSIVTKY